MSHNGHGHLYDDSSAPSLHGNNREIGAKEVKIKVSMPFMIKVIKSQPYDQIETESTHHH